MSFWSKLFGGGGGGESGGASDAGPAEEYKGYTITPVTMPNGAEYQLAGRIEKELGGTIQRHDFVRADRFSSKTEAASLTIAKGRQIIDEQGDGIFKQSWPAKPN